MQARKILIVAFVLVAVGATWALASECDVYKAVAARLLPDVVVTVVEATDLRFASDALEVNVTVIEENRSVRVVVTVVKALGKAALKAAANGLSYLAQLSL